ncbi:MAG: hypothetical protein ACP5KF_03205, partial [Sulfurihydrogenibium sp.]
MSKPLLYSLSLKYKSRNTLWSGSNCYINNEPVECPITSQYPIERVKLKSVYYVPIRVRNVAIPYERVKRAKQERQIAKSA